MINKIKKLLNKITNEDYESDKQARELALDAYNKVVDSLTHLDMSKGGWKPYEEIRKPSNIYLYGIAKYLLPEEVGIVISSPYKKQVSTGGHWSPSTSTIWINPDIDLDEDKFWSSGVFDSQEYFNIVMYKFKMSDIKERFMHEYTHYLDSLRYKDPEAVYKKYVSFKNDDNKSLDQSVKDFEKYTTQPIEYNAFYQSIIHTLENDLDRMTIPRQLQIFSKYLNFRGWIETYWNSLYDKYKNTELRQRVDKRLYKFYTGRKGELLEIEANPEPYIIKEVKKLFNKKSQSLIEYKLGIRHGEPSFMELIQWVCGEIPSIKAYLQEYKTQEKYYNYKYVKLVHNLAVEYYPELKKDLDRGLARWSNETGWNTNV